MCILIFAPEGQTIPKDHLEQSCAANPDGFGWATIYNDTDGKPRIISHRTMVAKEAIETFLDARTRWPEYPAIFHARIATHGTVTLDNCHPFYVGEDHATLLAHNGIMPIPAESGRSDTRQFAEEWMPMIGVENLDDPKTVQELEKFIDWSKVAFLTVDPRLKQWAYILNEDHGIWDDGVWYSNSGYRYATTFSNGQRWQSGWGGHFNQHAFTRSVDSLFDDDDFCQHCGADTTAMYTRWCAECGQDLFGEELVEDVAHTDSKDDPFVDSSAFDEGNYFIDSDGTLFVADSLSSFREAFQAEYKRYLAWRDSPRSTSAPSGRQLVKVT